MNLYLYIKSLGYLFGWNNLHLDSIFFIFSVSFELILVRFFFFCGIEVIQRISLVIFRSSLQQSTEEEGRDKSQKMEESSQDVSQMTSQQALCDPTERKSRKRLSTLKVLELFVTCTSQIFLFFFFLLILVFLQHILFDALKCNCLSIKTKKQTQVKSLKSRIMVQLLAAASCISKALGSRFGSGWVLPFALLLPFWGFSEDKQV